MDPTYTYSVPAAQMISGGFDTLSHIMETYFSKPDEDNVSDDIMEALAAFIREIGLPSTLRELGMEDEAGLKEIADSCGISAGSYKQLTHEEILEIFKECY